MVDNVVGVRDVEGPVVVSWDGGSSYVPLKEGWLSVPSEEGSAKMMTLEVEQLLAV